ncbi:hypothetical protein [Microbulbifer aggregans]|uniref:hypothetical protein n=1 Tax=Microbulbifer aggregans TaxID=1769779 RepID=UPI001CFE2AC2|nr:hypothetical protein [Microbulbifer aggregans]
MLRVDSKHGDIDLVLKSVDWPIGIGIVVELYSESELIGVLKLLCEKSHEKYESISRMDEYAIHKQVENALRDKIYERHLQSVLQFKQELKKLGFEQTSPIYGQLADAF